MPNPNLNSYHTQSYQKLRDGHTLGMLHRARLLSTQHISLRVHSQHEPRCEIDYYVMCVEVEKRTRLGREVKKIKIGRAHV